MAAEHRDVPCRQAQRPPPSGGPAPRWEECRRSHVSARRVRTSPRPWASRLSMRHSPFRCCWCHYVLDGGRPRKQLDLIASTRAGDTKIYPLGVTAVTPSSCSETRRHVAMRCLTSREREDVHRFHRNSYCARRGRGSSNEHISVSRFSRVGCRVSLSTLSRHMYILQYIKKQSHFVFERCERTPAT